MRVNPFTTTQHATALAIYVILFGLAFALNCVANCLHCGLITAGVIGLYVFLAYFRMDRL